jgi:dTDP-4-dehydrorhamnose reductase
MPLFFAATLFTGCTEYLCSKINQRTGCITMKKILLTGASGFLGGNFCSLYANAFDIHAVYHSHPVEIPGVKSVKLDICDEDALGRWFDEIKPDAVIHLAAFSDPNQCELHPKVSEQKNILASENMASLAAGLRLPMVFASTDLVFDGKSAPYKERDVPAPVSIYGLHKSIAEQAVLDIYPNAVVCRLPLMYGQSSSKDDSFGNSFLQPMLKKLSAGETMNMFTDEYRTVASARDICAGILVCLEERGEIFHLGGDERISRYNFARHVCGVFGFDAGLLIKTKQKDVKMPAPRPKDVSLNNEKAKELGWKPGTIIEELEWIKKNL